MFLENQWSRHAHFTRQWYAEYGWRGIFSVNQVEAKSLNLKDFCGAFEIFWKHAEAS